MKTYNKILLTVLIVFSLTFMVEMDVYHHHNDSNSHNECPLCVLNSVISSVAVLSTSAILIKPILNFDNVTSVYKVNILQNYSSYYSPDRAPPMA
jgi:hypothetical protein